MVRADRQRKSDGAGPSNAAEYEVGSRVSCRATFDGQYHVVDVIERKQDLRSSKWRYYVHYLEFDKRLDEWVAQERLASITKVASVDALHRVASGGGGGSGDLGQLASDQKMTRRLKRQYTEIHHVPAALEELPPIDQHLEKEHQEKTKVKNIQSVELGKHELDTWYYSPYPEPHASCNKLYICEYTLKYFRKKKTLLRHLAKCTLRHPPGDEIYRSPPAPANDPSLVGGAITNPPISMFEVDGKKSKVYCQNLCLLSKLFLDHKTLYYDVDPFLFYVMCEKDTQGYHIVGYFSKEKASAEGNNLACILTLPPYQRKGYGRFLIAFSYELSKKEGRVGSPERPLSDLGAVSYRSYWTREILEVLREHKASLSIKDISDKTAIRTDDVVKTLESLSLIKYWKGDHIISVTQKIVEDHCKTIANQKNIEIDLNRLHWTPYRQEPPSKKG
ncbi:putative MYST-like histone acetyltransferase 1 [Chlorella vulgaris]